MLSISRNNGAYRNEGVFSQDAQAVYMGKLTSRLSRDCSVFVVSALCTCAAHVRAFLGVCLPTELIDISCLCHIFEPANLQLFV